MHSIRPYKQSKRILFLRLVFLSVIGLLFYVERNTASILHSPWMLTTFFNKKLIGTPMTTMINAAISPTPSFLPKGEQTYTINSTDASPKIISLTLNPLDPAVHTKQSITVRPDTNQDIQNVFVTIYTDTNTYPLTLTSNDDVFTAQWTVKDTIFYRYVIKIVAQSTTKTSMTIISPRTNGPIDKSALD